MVTTVKERTEVEVAPGQWTLSEDGAEPQLVPPAPLVCASTIRAEYPGPSIPSAFADYCVGGALLRWMENAEIPWPGDVHADHDWPVAPDLASALMEMNPYLGWRGAKARARTITMSNDIGKFTRAWAALDRALTWAPRGRR